MSGTSNRTHGVVITWYITPKWRLQIMCHMVLEHTRPRPRALARSTSMERGRSPTAVSYGIAAAHVGSVPRRRTCIRPETSVPNLTGIRRRQYGRHRNTGVPHAEPHSVVLYVLYVLYVPPRRALHTRATCRRSDTIFGSHWRGDWRVVFEEPFFPPLCQLVGSVNAWSGIWPEGWQGKIDNLGACIISCWPFDCLSSWLNTIENMLHVL